MQARLQNGLIVQGGFGPGRQVTDDCDIVDDLPELLTATALIPNRSGVTVARPLEALPREQRMAYRAFQVSRHARSLKSMC